MEHCIWIWIATTFTLCEGKTTQNTLIGKRILSTSNKFDTGYVLEIEQKKSYCKEKKSLQVSLCNEEKKHQHLETLIV